MTRIAARALWSLVILLLFALVAWHLLKPADPSPAAPVPAAMPSPSASGWVQDREPGPLPDAAALTAQVKKAFAGGPGKYSVTVTDVHDGSTLVDLDGTRPGTPASSLKLLTGSAALATFSADHRFTTTVTRGANGAVVLHGGGDVLLGPGASQPQAVNGHVGVATLAKDAAAALKASGNATVSSVVVDTSLFPGAALNPGWAEDLITTNNITDVAPLALNAGRSGASHKSAVVRQPAQAAGQAFAAALAKELGGATPKVSVSADGSAGGANGAAASQGQAKPLASAESATVLQQLQYMEEHSDNYLAEVMGRMVAVERGGEGSIEGANAAVEATIKDLGVDTAGLSMKDTSGLAKTTTITSHTLAQLLSVAASGDRAELRELVYLLPVSGVSGTLATRLGGDDKALVRAKTGTLAAVVSLSGYVTTKDGRLLSFSVLASDVEGALAEARSAADRVAAVLVDCGCAKG